MSRNDKLSNYKTAVYDAKGFTNVLYHNTIVVSYNDESISLNSGGYRTVTTKRKMNQASNQFNLEYSVFQKKGDWYVTYRGLTVPFEDGIMLMRAE